MAREMKIPTWEQYKDSVYTYQVDMKILDQQLELVSTDAAWSTEDGSIVDIGTTSFDQGIASAQITAKQAGAARIKLAITTSVGDKPVYYFKIHVLEPEANVISSNGWR